MEKELHELRERLSKVEEWKKRKQEIDEELNKVWVEGGADLAPPPYLEDEESRELENSDVDADVDADEDAEGSRLLPQHGA